MGYAQYAALFLQGGNMFVDSHCHLDRLNLKKYQGDLGAALQFAREQGVHKMLNVCIDLEHFDEVLSIADAHEDIFASVGVHPSSNDGEDPSADQLVALAKAAKVIAIGETGLDYFYGADTKTQQQNRFIQHLEAARCCRKPVIVHTRDAREDTIAILRSHADHSVGGVMHCFTESWEMAKQALELGFYISFSGILTFKNAEELRDVALRVPLDRILIETDSPYLAPVPYRGKSNEPAFVGEVAKQIGELRGLDIEAVATITTENFERLFFRA